MQNLISVWSALELKRKIIVVAATLAMFASVLAITNLTTRTSNSLLYAGLESSAAGQVITALEQRGATYEVRGGAIYVDSAMRDELRMTLASEGLPANGSAGYELLDSLNGFGTTSQMFDAAYWRAKEGELARTILGSREISSARVHISNTSSSPFQRNRKSTASVTVTSSSGQVQPGHAKALKYLVASAVAGLSPEDVSVIDGGTGRVVMGDNEAGNSSEDSTSDKLRDRVQRLLEARVGPGNAIVVVSVEKITESESIVERTFDPDTRVAISKETEERTTDRKDAGGGNVTVASNLPEGDGAGGRNSSSQNSETRERINFEVSETQREILRIPGAIKRVSVAVLVDGVRTVNAEGEASWAPRPDEELEALRDLVASAVGFSEARGDQITLRTLEFEATAPGIPAENASLLSGLDLNVMSLIQLGVLALVSLLLGFFVVRPVLTSDRATALTGESNRLGLPGATSLSSSEQNSEFGQNTQSILTTQSTQTIAGSTDTIAAGEAGATPALAMAGDASQVEILEGDDQLAIENALDEETLILDPVQRLRELIDERREETVEILRGWVETSEERA